MVNSKSNLLAENQNGLAYNDHALRYFSEKATRHLDEFPKTSLSLLSLLLAGWRGKSRQHGQFLATAPSKREGRSSPDARGASVAAAAAPPQDLHPPTGRLGDLPSLRTRCAAEGPASAERGSRRRQGHGSPRGRGRRLGPPIALALLGTDTGGATAPQAARSRRPALDRRITETRDLPTALTRLPATSTPSPSGSRDVEGARRPRKL